MGSTNRIQRVIKKKGYESGRECWNSGGLGGECKSEKDNDTNTMYNDIIYIYEILRECVLKRVTV